MAVYTTGTADGRVRCNNATYTTARSGAGTFAVNTTANFMEVGQELSGGVYYCYEGFMGFDTSTIPSNATITSALLELYIVSVSTGSNSAGIVRVRVKDWSTTVTSADWVAGASVSGQTLVATMASLASLSGLTSTYQAAADVALAANITKAGVTRFMLTTDRFEAGTAPSAGGEYASFGTGEHASPSRLTVTWSVPGRTNRTGLLSIFALPSLALPGISGMARRPSGLLVAG